MTSYLVSLGNAQLVGGAGGDLYTTPDNKTTIVKVMRFANTDTAVQTINIYYKRAGGTARLVSPANLSLMPGMVAVDDQEITMQAGDKIQGKASAADKVDYVISGVERDV